MIARGLRRGKINVDVKLYALRKDLYSIESEVDPSIIYAAEKGYFALMRGKEYCICRIQDIGAMISACKDIEIAMEIGEVYKDLKELKLYETDFMKNCSFAS